MDSGTQNSDGQRTETTCPIPPSSTANPADPNNPGFLTAEEWLNLPNESTVPILGNVGNCIVRPLTKNIIQAPEKAFKTTFTLRLALGLSCGETVFPQLPVPNPQKVLYVHGELSPPEIRERTRSAAAGLPNPLNRCCEGLSFQVHLCQPLGQQVLRDLIAEHEPQVLILDPWQSFIWGCDENEFRDVSAATTFLTRLILDFGVTLFIVTHMGKDHRRGTRGHSTLAGWRDTLITLKREGQGDTVKVDIEPRWAPRLEPFILKFENDTLHPHHASFPFQKLAASGKRLKGRTLEIVEYLREHGSRVPRATLRDALKFPSDDAFRKALGRAQEVGAISCDGEMVTLPPEASAQAA